MVKQKVNHAKLSELFTCRLCNKYLRDATTICECLHSCKSFVPFFHLNLFSLFLFPPMFLLIITIQFSLVCFFQLHLHKLHECNSRKLLNLIYYLCEPKLSSCRLRKFSLLNLFGCKLKKNIRRN